MLGVIVTVTLCVMRPALAQDGRLIEASAVTLSDETLARLGPPAATRGKFTVSRRVLSQSSISGGKIQKLGISNSMSYK
jgi:hypothetical protein